MADNSAWAAQNAGYQAYQPPPPGQYPQPPHSQDYKMLLAGGGYADAPVGQQQGGMDMGPQHLDGTPVQPNRPSELYGGTVQGPVEMPAQSGYGR